MIYSQAPNLLYYGTDQTTFFVYPQVFIPINLQNSNIPVTGNIAPTCQIQIRNGTTQVEKDTRNKEQCTSLKIPKIQKSHLNIKNITPNLVRKLFGFLLSERCKTLMQKMDINITKVQISRVMTFVQSIKNSIGTYVGKRNLRKLWYKDSKVVKSSKTYEIIRRLSRYYLQVECSNSIILSKRIKSELKPIHLKYRRKLIRMLNENPELLK